MRTQTEFCVFVGLLTLACVLGAEDVRVTVFSLKNGKEVEALRLTAAETGGQVVFTITKTDGGRDLVFDSDVVKRTEKMVSVDRLPPEGQKLVEAGHAAEAATALRRKEEESAERERQRAANEQAVVAAKASQDDEPRRDALRVALLECEPIRVRCAELWDRWQAARARQVKAEDLRTRATTRYETARAELSGVAGMQPRSPREDQNIRSAVANLRSEMQAAATEVQTAEKLVKAATEEARVLQETLDLEKQRLSAAQKRIEELKAKR